MAPAAPVTWRDGVYLTGTPIWCDARRRRDVCFASAADRIAPVGHGQLIATPTTLRQAGASADGGHLGVPLRKPFTLGALRLELIAAGRCWGAASLFVDVRGRTVLYAGPIRTSAPPPGEPAADVRACDAVVVVAPYDVAEPFAPLATVAANVADWVRAQRAAGTPCAIVVDAPLEGVEVAAQLVAAGAVEPDRIGAARAVAAAHEKLPPETLAAAHLPALGAAGRDMHVVVRTERDRLPSFANAPTALVAGRAAEPHRYAHGFAWPFAAGRAELLAWLEQTKAREIFATGPGADAIVAELVRRGHAAQTIGPPQQMSLFEAAR